MFFLAYYIGSVVEITELAGHTFWWWITKEVKQCTAANWPHIR